MNRVFDIAVLIVWGAMLADLVTHPAGTGVIVNGFSNIWGNSISAVKGS